MLNTFIDMSLLPVAKNLLSSDTAIDKTRSIILAQKQVNESFKLLCMVLK